MPDLRRYRRSTADTKISDATAPADFTATGTADDTTYLRGDNVWAPLSGAGLGDMLGFNNLADVADAGDVFVVPKVCIGAIETDLHPTVTLVFEHQVSAVVVPGFPEFQPYRPIKDVGILDPRVPVHFAFGAPITVEGRGTVAHEKVLEFIESHLEDWGLPAVAH